MSIRSSLPRRLFRATGFAAALPLMALALSVSGGVASAQAATQPAAAHAATRPAAAHAATRPAAARAAYVVTTSGSSRAAAPVSTGAPARSTAAISCETFWSKVTWYDAIGKWLFYFQLNTYWCWDGHYVTYHSTWPTFGQSTLGSDAGWSYQGESESNFHCLQTYGPYHWCQSNYEDSTGHFELCILKYGCLQNIYPYIQQWENGVYGDAWSNQSDQGIN